MYARETSIENRPEVLIAAMREIRLCAMASTTAEGLHVTHLPVLVDDTGIVLTGHVARNNPHWRAVGSGAASVAIFQGPHSYTTPSWYETKRETGKVVPTWSYIAVHAHGRLETIQDQVWLRDHVSALTRFHEATQDQPWAVSDAPDDYVDVMLRGIIGLRLKVDRLVGSWKLNQHRSEADQIGMLDGLEHAGSEQQSALAAVMRKTSSRLTKG